MTPFIVLLGVMTVLQNAAQFAVLLSLPSVSKEERADYRSRLLGEVLQWIGVTGLFVVTLVFAYPTEKATRLGLMTLASSVALGLFWSLYIRARITKKAHDGDLSPRT